MEDQILPIDDIYVPVKRRARLNEETVRTLALEILEEGQKVPIQVQKILMNLIRLNLLVFLIIN